MIQVNPPTSDIINASATATTSGIVTVPGGRWLTANVQLSASVSVLGNSNPTVTYVIPGGTSDAAPANGSVLARINVTGLALTTVADSDTTEIIVYGGDNGCTLNFTAGAAGTSSVTINGFLI
jgi:uncharacterized protein RhaS with RHS repeats